jgi:hypothetical protein
VVSLVWRVVEATDGEVGCRVEELVSVQRLDSLLKIPTDGEEPTRSAPAENHCIRDAMRLGSARRGVGARRRSGH